MAYISVTQTFVNDTTGDPSHVNGNYTDIVSGLGDGTNTIAPFSLVFSSNTTASADSNTIWGVTNEKEGV